MSRPEVLVFSPRFNDTARVIANAAHRRGLRTETMSDWHVPEHLQGHDAAHLYAGPLYADAMAEGLELAMLEPAPDWLPSLPIEMTGREIVSMPIAEARELRRPAFIKPPNDKSFPARVYPDGSRLPGSDAVDDELMVLVSDVVTFSREFRLFILDGQVRTGSQYFREGQLDLAPLESHRDEAAVLAFADELLAAHAETLPSAVVVDIGMVRAADGRENLAVIEANMAWASGHYACDPDRTLDVVLRAALNRSLLAARDVPFVRSAIDATV